MIEQDFNCTGCTLKEMTYFFETMGIKPKTERGQKGSQQDSRGEGEDQANRGGPPSKARSRAVRARRCGRALLSAREACTPQTTMVLCAGL